MYQLAFYWMWILERIYKIGEFSTSQNQPLNFETLDQRYLKWHWTQYIFLILHICSFFWGFAIIKSTVRFVFTESILWWYVDSTKEEKQKPGVYIGYILWYHLGSIIASSIMIPIAYPIHFISTIFRWVLLQYRCKWIFFLADFLSIFSPQSVSGCVFSWTNYFVGSKNSVNT